MRPRKIVLNLNTIIQPRKKAMYMNSTTREILKYRMRYCMHQKSSGQHTSMTDKKVSCQRLSNIAQHLKRVASKKSSDVEKVACVIACPKQAEHGTTHGILKNRMRYCMHDKKKLASRRACVTKKVACLSQETIRCRKRVLHATLHGTQKKLHP